MDAGVEVGRAIYRLANGHHHRRGMIVALEDTLKNLSLAVFKGTMPWACIESVVAETRCFRVTCTRAAHMRVAA